MSITRKVIHLLSVCTAAQQTSHHYRCSISIDKIRLILRPFRIIFLLLNNVIDFFNAIVYTFRIDHLFCGFCAKFFSHMTFISGCGPVGRAPGLGPGCREFESRHSDQKSRFRLCGTWIFTLFGALRKNNLPEISPLFFSRKPQSDILTASFPFRMLAVFSIAHEFYRLQHQNNR